MQVQKQAQSQVVNSNCHVGCYPVVADPRPFRGERERDRPLSASRLEKSQENKMHINREQ